MFNFGFIPNKKPVIPNLFRELTGQSTRVKIHLACEMLKQVQHDLFLKL